MRRLNRQQLFKWSLIFAGWTLFAFFYASQALFINSYRENRLIWWRVLTWDLVFCYLWFLLTPVVLRLTFTTNLFPIESRAPTIITIRESISNRAETAATFLLRRLFF